MPDPEGGPRAPRFALSPRELPEPDAVANVVGDPDRLAALRGTGLLDTGPDESLDRFCRLAGELLDAPVSLISLVDKDREYFKSMVGLGEPWVSEREAPLSRSLCQYVVALDEPLAIGDARGAVPLRQRVELDELEVSSYAGVPLRDETGHAYGAFCVIDSQPRRWTSEQMEIVAQLGRAAEAQIGLRKRLSHALLNDPVTGLGNRDQFVDRIGEAIVATASPPVAVVAIGIAPVRSVKASLGHDLANRMLVGVAARLEHGLPDAVVARIDEDQFALLDRIRDERQVGALADQVRELLSSPLEIEGQLLYPVPSIGVAVAEPSDSAEGLLDGAIEALQHAQEAPERVEMLTGQTVRTVTLERLRIENALRTAIQEGALHVFYQPKLRLADRALSGFEALVRWEDPDLGPVPPSTFIPIAEASGLIGPLGQFVLSEACRQTAEWRRKFPALDLSVAVNVSPSQLRSTNISPLVATALQQSRLPPDRLTVEVTESALVRQTAAQLRRRLWKISELGVRLDLDDFGTGYSSLAHLAQLPLNAIKIDRSFVAGLADERTKVVVQAIVAMATALHLDVTVEGIETEAQLEQMAAMGCRVGQGYLFGHAQPAEATEAAIGEVQLVSL